MLDVHVHTARPCLCCTPMSMLHVHVKCCMSMSISVLHRLEHAALTWSCSMDTNVWTWTCCMYFILWNPLCEIHYDLDDCGAMWWHRNEHKLGVCKSIIKMIIFCCCRQALNTSKALIFDCSIFFNVNQNKLFFTCPNDSTLSTELLPTNVKNRKIIVHIPQKEERQWWFCLISGGKHPTVLLVQFFERFIHDYENRFDTV